MSSTVSTTPSITLPPSSSSDVSVSSTLTKTSHKTLYIILFIVVILIIIGLIVYFTSTSNPSSSPSPTSTSSTTPTSSPTSSPTSPPALPIPTSTPVAGTFYLITNASNNMLLTSAPNSVANCNFPNTGIVLTSGSSYATNWSFIPVPGASQTYNIQSTYTNDSGQSYMAFCSNCCNGLINWIADTHGDATELTSGYSQWVISPVSSSKTGVVGSVVILNVQANLFLAAWETNTGNTQYWQSNGTMTGICLVPTIDDNCYWTLTT